MIRYLILIISFSYIFITDTYTQEIQVHYLGHSSFILKFDDIIVVTDHGKPNAWKEWGWDSEIHDIGVLLPDIMTYSHLHEDHYDSTRITEGVKYILKNGEELNYKDLKITAIPTCEDQFGEFNNTSYLFSYKGVKILHTGDIQTMVANIENDSISEYFKSHYPENIDLLIMPIEGKIKYILQAEEFIQLLKPKNLIPMHYWSQEYLDEFLNYLSTREKVYNIVLNKSPYFNINANYIFRSVSVIVLERSDFK